MKLSILLFVHCLTLPVISSAAYLPGDQLSLISPPEKILKGIRKALKKSHVIDDVLDDFHPACHVRVSYGSHNEVVLGNKIKPSDTQHAPNIQVFCRKDDTEAYSKGFTVALTDPDAPSRDDPKWSEMCHWIAKISSESSSEAFPEYRVYGETQKLEDVVEYKPPGPPEKTGYHRYVFVLLHGDNSNLTAPSDRQHWGTGKTRHGVRDWASKEKLEVVGANFFVAKNKKQ